MSTVDQIIGNVGAISNVFILLVAVVSAMIALRSFIDSKKRRKREKAIELTIFYMDSILKPSAFISDAISDSDFEIASRKCFPLNSIKDFDLAEIKSLIKKHDPHLNIDKISKLFNEIPLEKIHSAILFRDEFISFNNKNQLYARHLKLDDEKAAKEFIEIVTRNQLNQSIVDLLNNIEWFAMNFSSGVADEETVYQSLHQTYLAIVSQLYFFIARKNDSEHAKYYTHTVSLFEEWLTKERNMTQIEERVNMKTNQMKKRITKKQKRI